MEYTNIVSARFISRPNRFVANVLLDGRETAVHVKNTGRCRELLVPDAEVFLEDFSTCPGKRKLLYDLVAVRKGDLLINMDSQAPNKVVFEALSEGSISLPGMDVLETIRPETTWGDSRFDFYVKDINGREGFIEVKGVTLEADGVASFPDAPTERGIKHLNGLIRAVEQGYHAFALFVIQMEGMRKFVPNDERHKAFGDALRNAAENNVEIIALECCVTPDSLRISSTVPIELG